MSSCPEIWSLAPAGSGTSFVFRFDPDVTGHVATAAREIECHGIGARSPFDPDRSLVDWSPEQLNAYREHVCDTGIDAVCESRRFLSPYLFLLPIEGMPPPDVDELLRGGHATVVRLRLNGGKAGTHGEAVQSVSDQLRKLDARSTLFLHHLRTLVVDINGDRRILERTIHPDIGIADHPRTRHQRVRVRSSGPTPDAAVTRQFHVWTRRLGGDDEPEETGRIRAVVEHLPNRWPEVCRVSVGVAVEEAPAATEGVFVIFLPTEMKTGTGAHINAPFYGSLDRRQINFDEPYNGLLFECVLDLCLDAVGGLVSREPEDWSAQAVVDLLSSTTTVDGGDCRLMEDLQDRASKRGTPLGDHALVLCDGGWCVPACARMMPHVPNDDPIGAERWREHAGFEVVSTVLGGREAAVETLLTDLDGSPNPQPQEWRDTVEQLATHVEARNIDVTWNALLNSLVSVLPSDLRREPKSDASDPLVDAKFLPTQDGGLVSANPESAALFFQPVRGIDDAADLVREVPGSLRDRIAFLHPDVRTHEQEGPRRRNTPVQMLQSKSIDHSRTGEQFASILHDDSPAWIVRRQKCRSAQALGCSIRQFVSKHADESPSRSGQPGPKTAAPIVSQPPSQATGRRLIRGSNVSASFIAEEFQRPGEDLRAAVSFGSSMRNWQLRQGGNDNIPEDVFPPIAPRKPTIEELQDTSKAKALVTDALVGVLRALRELAVPSKSSLRNGRPLLPTDSTGSGSVLNTNEIRRASSGSACASASCAFWSNSRMLLAHYCAAAGRVPPPAAASG